MAKPISPVVVGDFEFNRSTKNTHVFVRDVNGRTEPQYVQKSLLGETPPKAIRVILEVID